ncbi:hypothetical protein HLH26_08520 [Gluconacetobacter sp. 1b LMG 1731]|uniref:Uncharacterized protein n=1 Tax=Gluconacetobacter dulcium TaxID=2729096 RepID=A0A7W4IKV0_9PROT|nr:hypothetical protein [Gluconacetobacter dulcium]MBB2164584.1 hypothetical protein [Gluconacetobacter dulcium]MBB2193649.1 hypothetical protein [Gluconacetobacter dulcium]
MTDEPTTGSKKNMATLSGVDVNRADAGKAAERLDSALSQGILIDIKDILMEAPGKSLPASDLLKKLQSRFEIHPQNARHCLDSGISDGVLSWNGDTKVITYVAGS